MKSKFYGGNKTLDKMILREHINYYVPRVYASIACELWDKGWSAQEIEDLFALSQERWRESERDGWDMLENVQSVTGLKVKYFRETGNIV